MAIPATCRCGKPDDSPIDSAIVFDAGQHDYTLANLQLTNFATALDPPSAGLRLIGTKIGSAQVVTFVPEIAIAGLSRARLLGNFFAATTGGFLGCTSGCVVDGLEVGWNELRDGRSALSVDGAGGEISTLAFHDNFIKGFNQEGSASVIFDNFGEGAPIALSACTFFNNVFSLAPTSSWILGFYGVSGSASVTNNTFDGETTADLGTAPDGFLTFTDNIVSAQTAFITLRGGALQSLSPSHNLYDDSGGGGPIPVASEAGALLSNPLFSARADDDFSLQPTSPAIGAGVATDACGDYVGRVRSPPFDIGASSH